MSELRGAPVDEANPSDAELVAQALQGDRSAYAALADRWAPRLLAVCRCRTGNTHWAEDLAQEALLRGLRSLQRLESHQRFGPWLLGIAQRVWMDWRKARQSSQVPFTVLSPDAAPESFLATCENETARAADRAEDLRWLTEQIDRLPPDCREVLLLFYYERLRYRQIAEMLDVSTATVNSRLNKARSILRGRRRSLHREV